MSLWRVAVDAPLTDVLTYTTPQDGSVPQRGQSVTVPLGRRQVQGVVLGPGQPVEGVQLKPISSLSIEHPILPEEFLTWIEWLSQYYIHPPGLTAQLSFPPLKKQTKERKSQRAPVIPELQQQTPPQLTAEQDACIRGIKGHKEFSTHLVFGVTGSGKTEIYLRLLEEILQQGKSGLVLVPEIALTPQLIQRFAARFGNQIAALHSQLTDRERTNQWWDMIEGRKKILIGARSALFCPIKNLGLIIVDEEHEPSYKQEEKLKYHGRDAAVMRGRFANCPVVLGSATPSLESWKNAQDGKYHLHILRHRVADRALPHIEIVDLRKKEEPVPGIPTDLPFWMSGRLYQRLNETLAAGDQAALFLNRRGQAHVILCSSCGHTRQCPNCDINLTLHADSHLICHYCDYHENFKAKCSECRDGEMEKMGLGTELLEKDLAQLFPERRLARADRDEIQNRADLEDMIARMEASEIDILIGTQMIAKGLDFPRLKLVGLVLADIGFNMPDFRATERSFQLMTQMSGRSGRHVKEGESPGLVILQTFNTEHESLHFALNHDYEGFAAHEIVAREQLNYPPSGRLIGFRILCPDQGKARETARLLAQRAKTLQTRSELYLSLEILGPAEAPLAKLRNQYRFHLIIKGPQASTLNSFARRILGNEEWIPTSAKILVDVDPLNLL